MKFKQLLFLFLIPSVITFSCNNSKSNEELPWQETVGAQQFPDINKNKITITPSDDLDMVYTESIQNAIDEIAKKGGGTVDFQEGLYRIGSIFIKEGVCLNVGKGVTLQGIPLEKHYPTIDTRIAGIEMEWPAALINFLDVKNAMLTGEGTIDGEGRYFWNKYWEMRPGYEAKKLRWAVDYDCQRPRLLLVQNSSDITLQNVTLEEPGFWTVHILYSNQITADGLIVRGNIGGYGPSSDGIDIDSSTKIWVKNCDIDCNDDNFCLKAGKDGDGIRVNRPTEYVLIQDCLARYGHGLITFGSETSGSIRHIEAFNLEARGTQYGIRLKSAKTRGGVVEDVYLHDFNMQNVEVPIRGSLNWYPSYSYTSLPDGMTEVPEHWKALTYPIPEGKGIPKYQNFRLENITASNAKNAISLKGIEESLISDFQLKNVKITTENAGVLTYSENWSTENVTIEASNGKPIKLENCINVNL